MNAKQTAKLIRLYHEQPLPLDKLYTSEFTNIYLKMLQEGPFSPTEVWQHLIRLRKCGKLVRKPRRKGAKAMLKKHDPKNRVSGFYWPTDEAGAKQRMLMCDLLAAECRKTAAQAEPAYY
jgi:hypothetical protein